MKYYAGIGSRETPVEICNQMTAIASELEKIGYVLRSGGAYGADKAFSDGVENKSNKQIFLPWRGFNAIISEFESPTETALEIAEKFHPRWSGLKSGAKNLHGRNTHIILGPNCDSVVDFVVAYTSDGRFSGGTGQGLRIAQHHNIKIYNLYYQRDLDDILSFIDRERLEV